MMTLTEACNSGKRFNRSGSVDLDGYMTADEFLSGGISLEDFNATDYTTEPEVNVSIKLSSLMTAWNLARVRRDGTPRSSIATANSSEFFKEFIGKLNTSGVIINTDVTL